MAGNNGSIDEIIGQKGFDDVEQITQKMNTLYVAFKQNVTAINLMNDALSKATSVKDVTGGIDNITTKTKKANQVVTEFIETQSHLDNAVTLTGHALNEQELAYAKLTATMGNGNKAAKLVTEETKKQTKDTNDLKTAYSRLNDEYKASLIHSKNLAVQYGVTSKEFKAAAAQTNLMGGELKAIDAQLGIHSKNVGNYANGVTKGLSNAWAGIRKLAYIIPGMGIAGFFDLAFTTLSPLTDKLLEFAGVTQKAADAQKTFTELLKDSAQSAGGEIAHLQNLYAAATDVTLAMDLRKKAVNELQSQYPDYLKNLKDEAILAGNAQVAYDALVDSLVDKAIFKAIEEKQAPIAKDIVEMTKVLHDLEKERNTIHSVSATDIPETDEAKQDRFNKAIEKQKELIQDAKNQMKGLYEEGKQLFSLGGKTAQGKTDTPKEINRIEDLKKQYEAEKLIIETENEKGFTTELEYRNKLLALINEYVTAKESALGELSKNEKDSQTTFNLSLLRETKANTNAIEKYYADRLKMMEDYDAQVKKNDDIKVKDKQTVADKYADIDDALWKKQFAGTQAQLDDAKEKIEAELKLKRDKAVLEEAIINSTFAIANSISDAIYAKELQQIEDKATALDAAHEREIKQIEQSGLTSIQQTKAKAKADAQYEAEKKKIDKDRRKALHDEARLNRDLALLEVAIRTAANIVKVFPNPYLMGAAAALGVTETVAILVKPLPQYAKGRGKGKDEMAIVGEAGTEAIIRGDGSVEITPNRATTTFLKADDQVISNTDLIRSIQNSAYKSLSNKGTFTTDKLQNALISEFEKNTNEIKDLKKVLINKNLSVNTTNYGGFDSYLKSHIR